MLVEDVVVLFLLGELALAGVVALVGRRRRRRQTEIATLRQEHDDVGASRVRWRLVKRRLLVVRKLNVLLNRVLRMLLLLRINVLLDLNHLVLQQRRVEVLFTEQVYFFELLVFATVQRVAVRVEIVVNVKRVLLLMRSSI